MSSSVERIKNRVTKKANAPLEDSLVTFVDKMEPQVERALVDPELAKQFVRAVRTAIQANPKLMNCSRDSFAAAMMTSAQLGLIPNTPEGQAYLIPYGKDCQFILGYRGLMQLAYRSNKIESIEAHAVHENDIFEQEYGTNKKLRFVPAFGKDRGEVIGYYASFETTGGSISFTSMNKSEIEEHAKKFSPSYGKNKTSPWNTSFDSMAKKTVLKQLLKTAPLSSDARRSIYADEKIKRVDEPTLRDTNTDYLDMQGFTEFEIEPDDEPEEIETEKLTEETQQSFKS